ncbi:hypothetical protein BDM02DRAFT_984923 [Thelephora ganbajun]|uniref:Uncharacterized protein n=1 Tax=Thelephora ganbajun TaxID=370292 RepID=A0ACB6Z4F7_THEGA|nr:hypothetical protein BDM02DRAFT_984923 [Thelephora ganbajun]
MRPELSQFDAPVAVDEKRLGADHDQVPKRSTVVRQETDWILSYYQQAGTESEADNDEPSRDENQWAGARRISTPSTTSSDSNSAYSSEGDEPSSSSPTRAKSSEQGRERAGEDFASSLQTQRRRVDGERRNANQRSSELSADRRRIAVVELSPVLPLSTRRGQRPNITTTTIVSSDQPRCTNTRLAKKPSGIALVAPPDASPAAYTDLTPPSSAPAHISTTPIPTSNQDFPRHKRSISDVVDTRVSPRKSSRDVGIVGQLDDTTPRITRKTSSGIQSYFDIQGSKVPVFQIPHRSPMPSPIPESASVPSQYPPTTYPGQLTPEIGEAKDIHKPVVGPVVVDVNGAVRDKSGPLLTLSFSPSVPSSYLHYQPGVHSVAGPPPPLITRPGRSDNVGPVSPPPRPPRMHTPAISSPSSNPNLRHAGQQSSSLPVSKPPQLPSTSGESVSAHDRDPSQETVRFVATSINNIALDGPPLTKPFHTREGAFPPSTSGPLSPTPSPVLALKSSVSSIISSTLSDESIPPPTPQKDDPVPIPVRPPPSSSASTSRSSPQHPPRSRPVSMYNKLTDLPDVPSNSPGSPIINEKSLPSPAAGASNDPIPVFTSSARVSREDH